MEKVLSCKWLFGIVGAVLGFLALLQEHTLDGQNAWILALGIAAVCGAFTEVMNVLMYNKKFNLWNPISWVIGSVISILVSIIIW
jgi:hypothetical protein